MRTKLTRFFTITVLALVLGIASAAPVAAQQYQNESVMIIGITETTVLNTEARTVTVTTETFYSDGTWSRVTETWSYND